MGKKNKCHLLYADDTIIFCEPTTELLSYIRVILVLFEAVSRLKVNRGKSSLFSVNEVPQIQQLVNILGCKVDNLPTIYLGMPLGSNTKQWRYGRYYGKNGEETFFFETGNIVFLSIRGYAGHLQKC